MYFFAIVCFILAFTSIYTSSVSDVTWFKLTITTVYSILVAVLVTSNIFR